MLNLAQLLFAAFEKEPDKVAISDEKGEITWSELYRLALFTKKTGVWGLSEVNMLGFLRIII